MTIKANVLGSVPLSVLKTICDKKTSEDGFFNRILFVNPPVTVDAAARSARFEHGQSGAQ